MLPLSIIPSSPSVLTSFFVISLKLLLVLMVLKARKYPYKLQRNIRFSAVMLCLIYYLFNAIGSDYFAYKEMVEEVGHVNLLYYNSIDFHLEIPYIYIINFVHNNYFFFRLVVWGGALLVFYLTASYLELDKNTFIFYLCIFIVPLTAVSRVALAYAVGFGGFALIVYSKDRQRQLYLISGILLCFLSLWLLHRSAPFLLAVLPLSLLKFNKKVVGLLFLSVPIIVLIVKTGLMDFIFSMDSTAEDSLFDAQTAQWYLISESKFSSKGPGEFIRLFFEYLSFFLIIVHFVLIIRKGVYKILPSHIQKYINATILVITIAFIFLIMPGANTYKTFERLIAFAIVPAAFAMSYILKQGYEKKMTRYVNTAILLWVVYGSIYSLYLEIVL